MGGVSIKSITSAQGGVRRATVLRGGQNRQSRASRRCDILKCLQPAAGNRIHIQGHSRGAADVLKCGRTPVLAQATLTSNGILPAAISRITSDQEQEKKKGKKKKLKGCHSSRANCNSLKSGSGGSGVFFCLLKFHNLVSALRTPSGSRAESGSLMLPFWPLVRRKAEKWLFAHPHIPSLCTHTCALPWP